MESFFELFLLFLEELTFILSKFTKLQITFTSEELLGAVKFIADDLIASPSKDQGLKATDLLGEFLISPGALID